MGKPRNDSAERIAKALARLNPLDPTWSRFVVYERLHKRARALRKGANRGKA